MTQDKRETTADKWVYIEEGCELPKIGQRIDVLNYDGDVKSNIEVTDIFPATADSYTAMINKLRGNIAWRTAQ